MKKGERPGQALALHQVPFEKGTASIGTLLGWRHAILGLIVYIRILLLLLSRIARFAALLILAWPRRGVALLLLLLTALLRVARRVVLVTVHETLLIG